MYSQNDSNRQPMNVPSAQPTMPETYQTYPQQSVTPANDMVKSGQANYPDVYYKLKPYITMACDSMLTNGVKMPTQQQLEDVSDSVMEAFVNGNPEMAEYMQKSGWNAEYQQTPPPLQGAGRGGFRPWFGGFRRRGIGRDFVDALLLSEILGRGYYNPYPYPYYY